MIRTVLNCSARSEDFASPHRPFLGLARLILIKPIFQPNRPPASQLENMTNMIYSNPDPLSYPTDATVTELLFNHNLNSTPPNKPAIIDGITGEVVFTYATFRESVKKMASHFRDHLKLGPGSVVGILSTTKVLIRQACNFCFPFCSTARTQPLRHRGYICKTQLTLSMLHHRTTTRSAFTVSSPPAPSYLP